MKCDRCGNDITNSASYGGYAVAFNKTLCKECWEEYIAIQKEAYYKLNQFWKGLEK